MIRTNQTNLPEVIELLARDDYPTHKWDTFSVTELQRGVKEIILMRRYAEQLTEDISDLGAIITGNAIHASIEYLVKKYVDELKHEYLSETRFTLPIRGNFPYPVFISGAVDLFNLDTGHITDFKTGSASSYPFKVKEGFTEWRKQLRTYWWLLARSGYKPKSASNVLFNVGFSKYQMRKNPDYPRRSIIEVPQEFNPIITMEENAELNGEYAEKIRDVLEYKDAPDNEIPACSPDERWERDEHWAIMKKGRKTAVHRCWSKAEAEFVMESMSKDHFIEYRPGIPAKCLDWCNAKEKCNFYKNYIESLEKKRRNA